MTHLSPVSADYWLGETWIFGPVTCIDANGIAMNGATVAFRVFSETGVVVDAQGTANGEGIITFALFPSAQGFNPGLYEYSIRAFGPTGTFDQQFGPLNVHPSPFVTFPFTPPGISLDLNSGNIGLTAVL